MNRHPLRRSLVAMLVIGVLGSPPASATNEKPGCSQTIQIAASPLGRSMIVSGDEKVTGASRDFLDLVARDTGCKFEYVVVPRVRAFLMLKQGKIGIVPDATRSAERDEDAHFVETGKLAPMLITLKNRKVDVASIDELLDSSLSLITVKGYYFGPAYSSLLANPKMQGRINETVAPENAVKMLTVGRADALLMAPAVIVDAWEKFGNGNEPAVHELDDMPSLSFGYYLSTSNLSKADREKIEAAIISLSRQGEVRKLLRNYYPAWSVETTRSILKLKR